ncbi:uncharacterized protein LOC132194068 [Neocloeon triangulifer]|uniref:uncharacterized protein LOC132194068 n=1 Tax=Neocloeon triangulifer TaxID=2078957 RepID=UPI00286F977E|nr:uncharacterized protein LOC132194068 [Neocloeon triangulifer]
MLKLVVAALALVAVALADPPRELLDNPDFCNPKFLMQAEQCCSTLPKVFKKENFDACMPKDGAKSGESGEAGGAKSRNRRSPKKGGNGKDKSQRQGKSGPGGEGPRGPCPLAIAQCVLNQTGNINADGSVVQSAVLKSYQDAATTQEWKDLATKIVNACFDNVTATVKNLPPPPADAPKPADGKMVAPNALLTIVCIQTNLFINCPTSDRTSTLAAGEPDTCDTRYTKLGNCNPMFLPNPKDMKKGKENKGGRGGKGKSEKSVKKEKKSKSNKENNKQ